MLRTYLLCRSIAPANCLIPLRTHFSILPKVRTTIPCVRSSFLWKRFNSTQPVKNRKSDREVPLKSSQLHPLSNFQSSTPANTPENASLKGLLKDIYTVPNMLTMTRIAATPFIGYFIASGHSTAAISLFTYLCVTDFVDGYIARKFNLKSVLGSILDPLADKFLMTTCTVALYIGGGMPLYAASIIIGRDVMLSFMAFYMRYKSLPEPKTIKRYLDPKITTHTVLPNTLGKVNTALQMVYIGGLVLLPGLEQILTLPLDTIFSWYGLVVAGSTVASGATYLFSRGSAKLPVS